MAVDSTYERNFANFQLMEANYDDMRFGPVTIYFNPDDETDIIGIKTKQFATLEEFSQKLAIAEERLRFSSPYILKMLYVRPNEEDLTIDICFEYPNEDLISKALDLKNPNEVLKMLHDVLSGMSFLERVKMIHGNIRPEYIYYNPKTNNYILLDRLGENLTPNQIQHDNIFNNNYLYLDPMVFVNLCQNNLYFAHNPFKSESFSLGMVLVSMIVYDGPEHNNHLTVQDLYDREAAVFNEHRFLVLLQQIKSDFFQSTDHELVFDFITDCLLNLDTSQRLTPYKAYKLLRETLWKISTSNFSSLTHSGIRGLQDSGVRNEFVANIETKTLGANNELVQSDLSNPRDSDRKNQQILESEQFFDPEHQVTLQSSQYYDPQPPVESEVEHVEFRAGHLDQFVEPHSDRKARHNNESQFEQTITYENFNMVDAQHLMSARNSESQQRSGWTDGLDPAILHSNAFFNGQTQQDFFHGQTNLTEPQNPAAFFDVQPQMFSYPMPQQDPSFFGEQVLFDPNTPLYDNTIQFYDPNVPMFDNNQQFEEPPRESEGNFFKTTDLAKVVTDSYRPSETLEDENLFGKQSDHQIEPLSDHHSDYQQPDSHVIERQSQQQRTSNATERQSNQQRESTTNDRQSIQQRQSQQQSNRDVPQPNQQQEANIFTQQYEPSQRKIDDTMDQSMPANAFFQNQAFGYSQSFTTSNIPFNKNDMTFAQTAGLMTSHMTGDQSGLIRNHEQDESQIGLQSQIKEESLRLISNQEISNRNVQAIQLPEAEPRLSQQNRESQRQLSQIDQMTSQKLISASQSQKQIAQPQSHQSIHIHTHQDSTPGELRNYSHTPFPTSPDLVELQESVTEQRVNVPDAQMQVDLPQFERGSSDHTNHSNGLIDSKDDIKNQVNIYDSFKQDGRMSAQGNSLNENQMNVSANPDEFSQRDLHIKTVQSDFVFRESAPEPPVENLEYQELPTSDPKIESLSQNVDSQRQALPSNRDFNNLASIRSNMSMYKDVPDINVNYIESNLGHGIVQGNNTHLFRSITQEPRESSKAEVPNIQVDQSQAEEMINVVAPESKKEIRPESIPDQNYLEISSSQDQRYDSQADLKLSMGEANKLIKINNQSVATSKIDDTNSQVLPKKKKKNRSITPEKLSKNNLSKMMCCIVYDSVRYDSDEQSHVSKEQASKNLPQSQLQDPEILNHSVASQTKKQLPRESGQSISQEKSSKRRSITPEKLSKNNFNKVLSGVINDSMRIDTRDSRVPDERESIQKTNSTQQQQVFYSDNDTIISSIKNKGVQNQLTDQESQNIKNDEKIDIGPPVQSTFNKIQVQVMNDSARFDITEEAPSQMGKGDNNRLSDKSTLLNEIKMLDGSQVRANTQSVTTIKNGTIPENVKKHSSLPSKVNDEAALIANPKAMKEIYEEIEHDEGVDYDYSHSKQKVHTKGSEIPLNKQSLNNKNSVRGSAQLENRTPKMSLQLPELNEFNDITSGQQTNSFITGNLSANFNEGDHKVTDSQIQITKKIPAKRKTEGEMAPMTEDALMRDSKRPSLYKKGSARNLPNPVDIKIPPLINPAQYNFKKPMAQQDSIPRSQNVIFVSESPSPFIKPQPTPVVVNQQPVEYRSYNPTMIPVSTFIQNFKAYTVNKPNQPIALSQVSPQQPNIRVVSRNPDIVPRHNGPTDQSAKVIYLQQQAQGFAKVYEDQPGMFNSIPNQVNVSKSLPITKDGKIIINKEDFKSQGNSSTDHSSRYQQKPMDPKVMSYGSPNNVVYNAQMPSNYSIPLSQNGSSQKGIVFAQQGNMMPIKPPIQKMAQPLTFNSNAYQHYSSNYSNSSQNSNSQNPPLLIHQNSHTQFRMVNAPSPLPLKSESSNKDFFNFHKNAQMMSQYQSNPVQNNPRPSIDSNKKITRDASPIRTVNQPPPYQSMAQPNMPLNVPRQVMTQGSNPQIIYMNQQPLQNYNSNPQNVVYDFSKKVPMAQTPKVIPAQVNGPIPQSGQVIYTQQMSVQKPTVPVQISRPQTFGQEHFKSEGKPSVETDNRSRTPSRQINQTPQQYAKGVSSSQILVSGQDLVRGKQPGDIQRSLTPVKLVPGPAQQDNKPRKF